MQLHVILLFSASTICAGFTPAPNQNRCRFHTCLRAKNNEPAEASPTDGEFKQLRISFVTGNEMKRREVNTILNSCGATRGPTPDTSLVDLTLLNVDLPEIQELNTEAIAKNKAIQAAQLANGPCVVEDTSLAFTARLRRQVGRGVLHTGILSRPSRRPRGVYWKDQGDDRGARRRQRIWVGFHLCPRRGQRRALQLYDDRGEVRSEPSRQGRSTMGRVVGQ